MLLRKRYSDQEIIQKIREGESSILVYLYERNYVTLKNEIERRGGDTEQVQRLLRYELIQLWKDVHQLNPEDYQPVHEWIVARTIRRFEADPHDSHPLESQYEDRIKVFSQYLRFLDTVCRQVLFLFYFDGRSDEKIADQINFGDAPTARQKRWQCKRKLAQLIRQNFSKNDWT